jgi:hypothetical protein
LRRLKFVNDRQLSEVGQSGMGDRIETVLRTQVMERFQEDLNGGVDDDHRRWSPAIEDIKSAERVMMANFHLLSADQQNKKSIPNSTSDPVRGS